MIMFMFIHITSLALDNVSNRRLVLMFDWFGLAQTIFSLCMFVVAMAALFRDKGNDHDDDTESKIRMEQSLRQLLTDMTKMTIKLDEVLTTQSETQIAVALLNQSVDRAHKRLDTHSDRLDVIEQAHYTTVGSHNCKQSDMSQERFIRTQGSDSK